MKRKRKKVIHPCSRKVSTGSHLYTALGTGLFLLKMPLAS